MRIFVKVLFILTGVFTFHSAYAQEELILRKGYYPKTLARFKVGDEIRYSAKDQPEFLQDVIIDITDTSISFGDAKILLSNIDIIYLERNGFARNTFLKGIGRGLQVFALYHVVYGNLNSTIAKSWTKDFFENNLIVGTILFTTGTVLSVIYKKTMHRKCSLSKYRLTYFTY